MNVIRKLVLASLVCLGIVGTATTATAHVGWCSDGDCDAGVCAPYVQCHVGLDYCLWPHAEPGSHAVCRTLCPTLYVNNPWDSRFLAGAWVCA